MKNVLIFIIFSSLMPVTLHAQKQEAQLLKEPAGWTFERFNLPPVFAPNFSFTGAEELRFSPGMFDKKSNLYFTYAFAAQLNNRTSISKEEIKNYLFDYFKGLCSQTAKDRKLTVDTSKINVLIEKKNTVPHKDEIYNALLHVFGVFADGAPVQLNMEIKVLTNKTTGQVYLVFIASPLSKTDAVWEQLHTIQQNFSIPAEEKKP